MSLPARLRLTMLMTLAVYPVVTLYLYVLMPLTNGWDIWQRSLILVPMMSATIVLAVVPFINKRFSTFIAGRRAAAA